MADKFYVCSELYNLHSNRTISMYCTEFETDEAAKAAFEAVSIENIAETYAIWLGDPCAVKVSYQIGYDINEQFEQFIPFKSQTFYLENMEACNA